MSLAISFSLILLSLFPSVSGGSITLAIGMLDIDSCQSLGDAIEAFGPKRAEGECH